MAPLRGEVNFICMPGVRAMYLDDETLVLVHPAMPPALVDLRTGELEELVA